jgi:acyl-CoA synthetase (AMP-forming)/AMP-acid ligase II
MSGAATAGFRPIAATVAERCAADPDRVAVEWAGASLSAGQLGAWAERIAAELSAAGLTPGDRVAIAARRSFGLVAALLGALAAGGVIVPIDRALPPQRRRVMLERSGAALLVTVGDDELAGARPGPAVGQLPDGDLDGRLVAE